MKIICTENEEEWIKKLLVESDDCALNKNHCELLVPTNIKNICKRCIEENIEFEREQTRWIPCSERLPKKSGEYWCTFGKTNLMGSDYYTTESDAKKIFDDPEEYVGWQSHNVIAWMLLPKKYKAETEKGENKS